jgi:hypothetical protein
VSAIIDMGKNLKQPVIAPRVLKRRGSSHSFGPNDVGKDKAISSAGRRPPRNLHLRQQRAVR